MEHTKEPWMQHEDEPSAIVARHDKNMSLLTIALDGMATLYSEADARRIVQCVNACAGLSQFALDGGWTALGMSAYAKRLGQQRDELLAALEHLLAGSLSLPRFAEEQARSAIEHAKGA